MHGILWAFLIAQSTIALCSYVCRLIKSVVSGDCHCMRTSAPQHMQDLLHHCKKLKCPPHLHAVLQL